MKQSLSQRIFFNINWILLEKISKALLTGITSIVIARYLGPEGLGLLSLALSIYSIFTVFSALGLERVILRELEEPQNTAEKVLGSAFLLRSIGSVLAFVLINVNTTYLYQDNHKLQFMVFLLSLSFFISIFFTFESYYRRQLRSKNVTIVRVLGLFASAILKVIIVAFGIDVVWFVLPAILEVAVISLGFVYLRFYDVKMTLGKMKYSISGAKTMLKFAWPLTLSGVAGTLYFHMDRIVIHQFWDEAELGRYALLAQLVSMLVIAFNAINLSFTPFLNKVFFENESKFWVTLKEVTAYKLLLALVIGLCFPFVINPIVPLLAGPGFVYSGALLWCFSLYIFCIALGSLNVEYWVLKKSVKPIFYIRIVTLILNIVLNIVLIPRMGIVGAAVATIVSTILQMFILPIFNPDMRKVVKSNASSLIYLFHSEMYKGLYSKLRVVLANCR